MRRHGIERAHQYRLKTAAICRYPLPRHGLVQECDFGMDTCSAAATVHLVRMDLPRKTFHICPAWMIHEQRTHPRSVIHFLPSHPPSCFRLRWHGVDETQQQKPTKNPLSVLSAYTSLAFHERWVRRGHVRRLQSSILQHGVATVCATAHAAMLQLCRLGVRAVLPSPFSLILKFTLIHSGSHHHHTHTNRLPPR